MSLIQAATMCQAEIQGNDIEICGVSTDTRSIGKNQLFVALTGENFDGHAFVEQARQNGAGAAMISQDVDTQLPCLKVTDTLTGLQMLAANWRNQFDMPVIGVTGSNGKTTVKELIGSIVKVHFGKVLVTQGNLNNHIGVPLTLLRLNSDHRCAVVEMGMNHPGEISLLTHLTKPDVALVNNAMLAHVAAFDSVGQVAQAKAEIFESLSAHGIAVLNGDDENFDLLKQLAAPHECIDFSLDREATITASFKQLDHQSQLEISTPAGQFSCKMNLLGKHNAMNALAAVACAHALDVSLSSIKKGLEQVQPVTGRLQPLKLDHGMVLLNDTYNANPDSMKAGIDVLAQLPGAKKILVAGDMGELGKDSAQYHAQIGQYAHEQGLDCFLSFGPLMKHGTKTFGNQGFNTEDLNELITRLKAELSDDCRILVKGSRSMRMERVVEALTSNTSGGLH